MVDVLAKGVRSCSRLWTPRYGFRATNHEIPPFNKKPAYARKLGERGASLIPPTTMRDSYKTRISHREFGLTESRSLLANLAGRSGLVPSKSALQPVARFHR